MGLNCRDKWAEPISNFQCFAAHGLKKMAGFLELVETRAGAFVSSRLPFQNTPNDRALYCGMASGGDGDGAGAKGLHAPPARRPSAHALRNRYAGRPDSAPDNPICQRRSCVRQATYGASPPPASCASTGVLCRAQVQRDEDGASGAPFHLLLLFQQVSV